MVDQVVVQITRYLIVFIGLYSFGLINRTVNLIISSSGGVPCRPRPYLLQAVFNPLQGFGNAIVYCGLYTRLANWLRSGSLARRSAISACGC